MRIICTLLITALCCTVTFTTPVEDNQSNNVVDKEFLLKQKDLLRLFKSVVLQTNYYEDQAEIAKKYTLKDDLLKSTNETAARTFSKLHRIGLLPRGAVFTIFNDRHRQQAVALFDVLYYANNWDSFYKIACWAREYVNEAMFVYVMHVAVMHRADTKHFMLPPIYEIYPNYFLNKADKVYLRRYDNENVTAPKYNIKEQDDLAYFHDDIQNNANYYYFHIAYPFWMDSNKYGLPKDIRGELFYFLHQQILARYNMARFTEGYGTVDVFNWQSPIKMGYKPRIAYPNGVIFPSRPVDANLVYNSNNTTQNHFFQIQDIEDYESRIREAIAFGHILTSDIKRENIYRDNGFNDLANLVECNADSKNTRHFGPLQTLARQVLGYTFPINNTNIVAASVLEHFETSARDPMFYQFFNRIVHYLATYKNNLPEYNQTELKCAGVKINNVTMSKLNTFFERFEFDISNMLYTKEEVKNGHPDRPLIHHQNRLTHEPFTYKINVTSNTATDVVVRVFIGPKYDGEQNEITFNENRLFFFEFDKFKYSLEEGENIITRNSTQGKSIADRIGFRTLYQNVLDALNGATDFKHTMPGLRTGFVLPKGSSQGRTHKFFVFISPQPSAKDIKGYKTDGRSFGFPLDRQISDEPSFFLPNSYLFEEKIYHLEKKIDY